LPAIGDTVLVTLDVGTVRPLIVGAITDVRVSGLLVCEPEDHNTPALRNLTTGGVNPGRFHGRPERYNPFVYAELLTLGKGIGQWHPRQKTPLPSL
jgi:hypothetical protein